MKRRTILLAAPAMAMTALSIKAHAADPVKVMVPGGPAGGYDTTARQTMQALSKAGIFKDPVQYTNRGGAGGTIGLTEFVNSSRNQDNALLFMGAIMVGGAAMNPSPVSLSDTTPLARLIVDHGAVVVPRNSPHQTLQDLLAAFKKDPGAVAIGGGSLGSVDHIALALIAKAQDIPINKLNYLGYPSSAEVVTGLIGNRLAAAISGVAEFKQFLGNGRLRVLAVTSESRIPGIDAPTLKEAGIDVVIGNWRGVVGAPGMSAAGKARWVETFNRLSQSPAWKDTLQQQGWDDAYLSGDAFASFLSAEVDRVGRVIKEVGLAS
jgi:putative tricarboxylic transport membrane protein